MKLSGPGERARIAGASLLLAACWLHPRAEVRAEREPPAPEKAAAATTSARQAKAAPSQPAPTPPPTTAAGPLAAFHQSLRLSHRAGTKTRVLFFGDSHTAADCMTGRLRERLQADYGDGGPGFLMAGKPWAYYHHGRAQVLESRGLRATFVRKAPEGDAFPLGLAGVALVGGDVEPVSVRLRITSALAPAGRALHGELYFLKQPEGATLDLLLDGQPLLPLPTAGELGPGYLALDAPDDGPHELELRAPAETPLTLLGLVAELEGGGVVLDTLGIPGARARAHLYWEPTLFREQVQRRAPALWVLAYGTNESTDITQPIEDYASRLRQVIGNLRASAPNASCLLVGPTDFPERIKKQGYRARERNMRINQAQRSLAEASGCAFFDTIATMGGPLSMLDWATRDPPLGARDRVHLTQAGYAILGDAIADAILPTSTTATAKLQSRGLRR